MIDRKNQLYMIVRVSYDFTMQQPTRGVNKMIIKQEAVWAPIDIKLTTRDEAEQLEEDLNYMRNHCGDDIMNNVSKELIKCLGAALIGKEISQGGES